MKCHTQMLLAVGTLATSTLSTMALQVRTYLPATHDRFTGFPATPVINGSSFFDGTKLHGLGWSNSDTRKQFTLVTRSHLLFATHFIPPIGEEIRFLNDSGQIVSRLVTARTFVDNPDNTDSDLTLVTFAPPIDFDEGVEPFPYLNLASNAAYQGKQLIAFGKYARAGRGVFDGFVNISGAGLNPTSAFNFDYDSEGVGADDAKLESGDSGSPSFHLTGGKMCLVGIHSAIDTEGTVQSNFDSFVPDYVDELDLLLAPQGYRMRPSDGMTTTLTASSTAVTPTPRKGNPLSLTFELTNSGTEETGNLEVDFDFAMGEEPDSISGTDWVSDNSGSSWTLKKALLGPSSSATLTLTWSAAPLIENLAIGIDWRSDMSVDGSLDPNYMLESSFNEWADGLSMPGMMDNPDGDEFLNVSEYAFGSDAEHGSNLLPNGEPARPVITGSGTMVTLIYPERSDAASRGLSYSPEWSNHPGDESWSATPPPGLLSSTSAYDPPVPGFIKRTLVWSTSDSWHFARVGVSLDE